MLGFPVCFPLLSPYHNKSNAPLLLKKEVACLSESSGTDSLASYARLTSILLCTEVGMERPVLGMVPRPCTHNFCPVEARSSIERIERAWNSISLSMPRSFPVVFIILSLPLASSPVPGLMSDELHLSSGSKRRKISPGLVTYAL